MVSDLPTFLVSATETLLAVASRLEAINTHLGVGETDDRAATDLWLAEHSNPQTLRNYRREVDRALMWARLLGKSLAQIGVPLFSVQKVTVGERALAWGWSF